MSFSSVASIVFLNLNLLSSFSIFRIRTLGQWLFGTVLHSLLSAALSYLSYLLAGNTAVLKVCACRRLLLNRTGCMLRPLQSLLLFPGMLAAPRLLSCAYDSCNWQQHRTQIRTMSTPDQVWTSALIPLVSCQTAGACASSLLVSSTVTKWSKTSWNKS